MWSVKCVECGMKSVECKVWSAECEVYSVECVECKKRVECGVQKV